MRLLSIAVMAISLLMLAAAGAARPSNADLRKQVFDAERAFAATMKARDHAAFSGFIDGEAVFLSGSKPLRGRAAILEAWRSYYVGAQAPFSWAPDQVEVLDSGPSDASTRSGGWKRRGAGRSCSTAAKRRRATAHRDHAGSACSTSSCTLVTPLYSLASSRNATRALSPSASVWPNQIAS